MNMHPFFTKKKILMIKEFFPVIITKAVTVSQAPR